MTNPIRIIFCQRHLANGVAERPEVPATLRALGHDVREIQDDPREIPSSPDLLLWIQGNANWYPKICARLERLASSSDRPRVVLWHTEPLPPTPGSSLPRPRLHLREIAKVLLRDRRATDVYTNARRLKRLARFSIPDRLVVSAPARREYLSACGIASEFVPLGYDEAAHGRDLNLPRDIDVLVLGTMQVPRRRRLVEQLRSAGVNVRAEGSWNDRSAWGENRTQLLNRTKILLNLPRHPGEFSGLRMILGMCNGAMVVSEPIESPEPYVPGRHYIEASIERMPEVISHYLAFAEERQRFVSEARRFITNDLSMRHSVQRILDLVDEKALATAS